MAARVRSGKPWCHDHNDRGNYEIMSIIAKRIRICRGVQKVQYYVEMKSPINAAKPYFWADEDDMNAPELIANILKFKVYDQQNEEWSDPVYKKKNSELHGRCNTGTIHDKKTNCY